MSKPTNKEVFDYYADKDTDTFTLKYINQFQSDDEPYITLAKDFTDIQKLPLHERRENRSLYTILYLWEHQHMAEPVEIFDEGESKPHLSLSPLDLDMKLNTVNASLKKLVNINLTHPTLTNGVPSQKWHLYVGYMLYSLICHKFFGDYLWETDYWNKEFDYSYKLNSTAIKLWMLENSDSEIDFCKNLNFEKSKEALDEEIKLEYRQYVANWN